MNNNRTDESALLGVFSKTSYITFGENEKPLQYPVKGSDRANFKGKQMTTTTLKEGKTNDVYFEKKHNWIADGDKFKDRLMYQEMQKEKKKGFLSGDFKRRDEFSMTFRMEQYREQLKMEATKTKEAIETMAALTHVDPAASLHASMQPEDGPLLYDLVFEKYDIGKKDPSAGASKVSRDTMNPTHLRKDRNLGTFKTTSCMAFAPPPDHSKPDHARKPIIRDTFYRKTNVFFPSSGQPELAANE